MTKLDRRTLLKLLGAAPSFSSLRVSEATVRKAAASVARAQAQAGSFQPQFFTSAEYETVRVLADWIIPADDRSGSAIDAGVPEFIDFIVADMPDDYQIPMRGGLSLLDLECSERWNQPFRSCSRDQQRELLEIIAFPERAPAQMRHLVEFFNTLRDLTADGFWSSKMGMQDLPFQGNVFTDWNGCPQEVLDRLDLGD